MAKLSVSSPTSRRRYLSQDELVQFANITINDSDEADDKISQAEELIDAYVGYQDRFFQNELSGKASAATSSSITLQSSQQNAYQNDYFKNMNLEIIGGTGAGQIVIISASTYAGVLTTESFGTTPDSTSIYRIWQLGKFPRKKDVWYDSESGNDKYYKRIPEAVRRAVAAQVEFEIEMGEAHFKTDKNDMISESIGDYSYTRASGSNIDRMIAPKAKQFLRGLRNRKGAIIR